MKTAIDMNALLAPISGTDPAGENLRYSSNLYDEIREARRADDPLLWEGPERELKSADWGRVIDLCLEALTQKSKDLQVAAWLTEALAAREGFQGLGVGLRAMTALLENFWDGLYPRIEEDDYDYRAAPLEFLNDRVSLALWQLPLTDPRSTPGHDFLSYQQSREVAARPGERDQLLAEGKLAPEQFETAVQKSPAGFYTSLAEALDEASRELCALEALVDASFGPNAPSLSTLGKVLEETTRLVLRICLEQKGLQEAFSGHPAALEEGALPAPAHSPGPGGDPPGPAEGKCRETQIWQDALSLLAGRGVKEALALLVAAASRQSSERGRCRYRFLVAKLCLKAGRPDLARPIVEQLNQTIAELQLEQWESPFWVSEIYQALHQCLISGEDAYDEASRAKELLRKICIMDVTKAL